MRLHRAAILLSLMLVVASCGWGDPQPSATDATIVPTDESDFPNGLVASLVGGAGFLQASLDPDGGLGSWQQDDPPAGDVAGVVRAVNGVFLNTCCEPAAGTRWFLPDDKGAEQIGWGETVDADGNRTLIVDPNGGFVRLETANGEAAVLTSHTGEWMPVDGALAPATQHLVIVALGTSDEVAVFWIPYGNAEYFDGQPPLVTSSHLGAVPGRPAVDRHGHVWVITFQRIFDEPINRLRLDPDTGDATDVTTAHAPPVAQAFDQSGTFLLTAHADGKTTWRTWDNDRETILDLPPVDRVDW